MSDTSPYQHLYKTAAWLKLRESVLAEEPLCRRCGEQGRVRAATVVHHIIPHKGDASTFFSGPFEALCKTCHDSSAQQEERNGYRSDIGIDGWPIDPRHPVNLD